jgi:F0F1-type ATP synthase assembly protein I
MFAGSGSALQAVWELNLATGAEAQFIGIQVAGAMLLFVLAGYLADGWLNTSPWLLILGAVLGVVAMIEPPEEGTPWGFTVTGVLAVAMGLQAAAARRIAVKDVTTVVVTSTLTGLAADSRLALGNGENWARRLLAVALILAGAAFGALLLHLAGSAGVGLGMLVAGLGSIAVTVVGHLRHR